MAIANCRNNKIINRKGRLSNLRDVIKEQGFEIYTMKKEETLHLLKQENFDNK